MNHHVGLEDMDIFGLHYNGFLILYQFYFLSIHSSIIGSLLGD